MNSRLEAMLGPLRHLGLRFWVPFLSACVIVFVGELVLEYAVENEAGPGLTQSIFNFAGLYQRIVTAPRSPLSRSTVVVEINPENDPAVVGLTDACNQRGMLTGLISRIAAKQPAVIVLDKWYEPRSQPCSHDSEFINAIQTARRNIPVIVGRLVHDDGIGTGSAARYYLVPSIVPDDANPCKVGAVNMDFESGQVPCLEGVVNLDLDTRKLPLAWSLFPNEEAAQKGEGENWYDTLALKAARAFESKLMSRHRRLASFVGRHEHPYISFLQMSDIDNVLAGRLLSADGTSVSSGGSSKEGPATDIPRMSGKVILIGEINWAMDAHQTVMGRMPGVYAQANYVEALLDDRYFRPLPVVDYLFGFVFLVALELILIIYRGHWLTMGLLIAALLIFSVALLYLMIMHLGWYVNPAAVGLIAVVLRGFSLFFGRAEREATVQETKAVSAANEPKSP